MYGWRGRIGVILPPDNTVIEPELERFYPDGVRAFSVRLNTLGREEGVEQALELGPPVFEMIGIHVVAYCCAATTFYQGAEAERRLAARLGKACRLPVVTAASAMVSALQNVDAQRIALLTPYSESLTGLLVSFLQEHGIEATAVHALEFPTVDSNLAWPERAYAALRDLDVSGTQAVLVSSTAFRTLEIIELAERDLGIPVISSNRALAWATLAQLGVRRDGKGA